MANSLFANFMITEGIKEKACNQNLDSSVRGIALLDGVQSRLEGEPSDFSKFVVVLESKGGFFKSQAEKLVQSYCE